MNKPNKIDTNFIIRVEGKNAFHRGDTFDDFEQVANRLRAHTQESLVYYWTRDSRLVKFAHTKVSRKLNENLHYYSIRFSCIFGGQRFKSKANGLRPCKRQTRQIDCPAFISLRATKCGLKLEVIDVCNDHTHENTEQAVEELPQKRRPSQSLLEEIHELLHLNVDKKMIIEYVKQKENKNILKKDLFNMATHLGLSTTRNEDDQKAILQRITLTATQDPIQHAVLNKLLQFESNFSLNTEAFPNNLQPTQSPLDVFDRSRSSSPIGFPPLAPQTDLLNATDSIKQEYDELLSNRIAVDFEEDPKTMDEEQTLNSNANSLPENSWNEEARSTVIYEDLICGAETSYTYDDLNLTKHIQEQELAQQTSNHSNEIDDKEEYFNDLILMSPDEAICPTEINFETTKLINENECAIADQDNNRVPLALEIPKKFEAVKSNNQSQYAALKTRRKITKCRSCGTNVRLIKMQLSYLRQQKLKLLEETKVLRLKKLKLKAEIEAINSGLM